MPFQISQSRGIGLGVEPSELGSQKIQSSPYIFLSKTTAGGGRLRKTCAVHRLLGDLGSRYPREAGAMHFFRLFQSPRNGTIWWFKWN